MMPGMDGFEVLEAMRREEAWRDIPVVVVTAKDLTARSWRGSTGMPRECFQKGAYNRAELIGVVHGMIARRMAERRAAAARRGLA